MGQQTIAETETGKTPDQEQNRFVLVCLPERSEAYREALGESPARIEMVSNLDALLTSCVNHPPMAVLLDMTLVTQIGTRVLAPVFELRMNWPVIRCSLLSDGQLNGLCMEPRAHGPLLPMLEDITAGKEVWRRELRPARARRRHLRIEAQCRVRWRIVGEKTWRRGTTLDLGAGGAFIVTYDELEKGTQLDLEISDILPDPAQMKATVMGGRRWEDSRLLPGMGVEFDEASIPDAFKQKLAESITLDNLV
ncbi:MAG: PilZ domain-containing protein [Pirellulales bacterium]|nr:PilZ domain-containing protein [Pirellulales bacterium]